MLCGRALNIKHLFLGGPISRPMDNSPHSLCWASGVCFTYLPFIRRNEPGVPTRARARAFGKPGKRSPDIGVILIPLTLVADRSVVMTRRFRTLRSSLLHGGSWWRSLCKAIARVLSMCILKPKLGMARYAARLLPLVSSSGDTRLVFDLPTQGMESDVYSFLVSSPLPDQEGESTTIFALS